MTMFERLRKSERGVTAVEFALIALPMFTLIMGSIEFGLNMFTKAALDGALKEAARMATTGDPTITGTNGAAIDSMVTKKVTIVSNAQVQITKQFYDRFDQVKRPEPKTSGGAAPPYCFDDENGNRRWDLDAGRTGLGGADDIINYRVTVSYPALFPLVTNVVTGRNTMNLTGEISLRNEPFAGGTDVAVKNCCVGAAPANTVTCS